MDCPLRDYFISTRLQTFVGFHEKISSEVHLNIHTRDKSKQHYKDKNSG